ncbi:GT4 family glycosyltransferase PelF [Raineyella sp.]|uniref:GT4 family glycosyltransferase PelF n=1 Tax=Raineyella sp. TaxID=1911550 RepID=UPI002B213061|nr:GT4 family glycosyltransferase PelF [Raineyella sp.]MEA5154278.1 GT4 family glycosyltransferase PelF [Raineyella sp.]
MRIGLFTEGTYPVTTGGVTRWCELLIGGLPEHTFVPVTIIGSDEQVVVRTPDNVTDITLVPMWGRTRPALVARRRRALEDLLGEIWSAALPAAEDRDSDVERFGRAARELTAWHGPRLSRLLATEGSVRALLAAWRAQRRVRPTLPPLTLADAVRASAHVDRVLALADVRFPDVDVSHVGANGPSALLALGRWWSAGTPILLTEHGIYLRERYLAMTRTDLGWPARRAVGAFLRVLSQLAYQEAIRITPVSDFNQRWERLLGADPDKIETIHNGVETDLFRPIDTEPAVPTISFVGRIDPLKDLATLVSAVDIVRRQVPDVRLRVFGPTPEGNEAYRDELTGQVAGLGLTEVISFEGAVSSALPALEAGHVVALSSISEGLPYTVIEAMMAGRATVNTDVGGVAEVVGDDGVCGALVPPRDPEALATALAELLTDDDARREMGRRARQRALAMFNLDLFTQRYQQAYLTVRDAAGPVPTMAAARGRRSAAVARSGVPVGAAAGPPGRPAATGQDALAVERRA